jgi:hypothetical protein
VIRTVRDGQHPAGARVTALQQSGENVAPLGREAPGIAQDRRDVGVPAEHPETGPIAGRLLPVDRILTPQPRPHRGHVAAGERGRIRQIGYGSPGARHDVVNSSGVHR